MLRRTHGPADQWSFGDAHPASTWGAIVFADFQGTSGDDTINGTDGDDTIDGLGGNDMLKGGLGNDVIHGGTGNDFLNGNDGNDTLYGDAGNNELHGGVGDDIIYASTGIDLIYGGPGQNTIRNGTAKTTVYTDLGNIDTIDRAGIWNVDYSASTVGVSIVNHSRGSDYSTVFSDGNRSTGVDQGNFILGSGEDSFTAQRLYGFAVDAGAGADSFRLDINSAKRLQISLTAADDGSPVLNTGYRNYPLFSIYTNFENFVIDAGSRRGRVTIDGSVLYNGTHLDLTAVSATLDFRSATQAVDFEVVGSVGQVNGSTFHVSGYTIRLNDLGGRVVASGLLYGGAGDDYLAATAFSYTSVLNGGAGDDTLVGASRYSTLTGGAGDDGITGGDFDDKITGDGGDDTIDGGVGNDTIDGGANDDIVNGSAGIDHLTGGLGTNTIDGGADNDTIVSAAGAIDTVDGGAGTDTWTGDFSARQDALTLTWNGSLTVSDGSSVTNVEQASLVLGGGDDHVAVTGVSGNVLTLAAGAGSDVIDFALAGSAVTVSLAQSGSQNTGGGGSMKISGFEGLIGSAFNDVLTGDGGANTLTGGGGADVLTGGAGADRFGFASLSDLSTSTNINQMDRLTDFAHFEGDTIDLSAIDADPNADGDQAFSFIGTKRFDANGTGPGEIRFSQSVDGYLLVQGDLNHDGKADFSFLVHNTALVAGDLVL